MKLDGYGDWGVDLELALCSAPRNRTEWREERAPAKKTEVYKQGKWAPLFHDNIFPLSSDSWFKDFLSHRESLYKLFSISSLDFSEPGRF